MSKIFLDHNYKCYTLKTLSSTPDKIIESLCGNPENSNTKKILNQISNAIIVNKLYAPESGSLLPYKAASDSLLPHNSRLYSHGTNTNETPELQQIRDLIELKLKIDRVENEDGDTILQGNKLTTGHFRFHLPPVLGPQILIMIKDPNPEGNNLLLLFHGNIKLLSVFTSYLQSKFDCTVDEVRIKDQVMKNIMNWSIMDDVLDSVTGLELWFGKLQTSGKLGSIIIKIEAEDIKVLGKAVASDKSKTGLEFSELLYDHLNKNTSISFDQISLVQMRCDLFTISSDGKLKMLRSMTHLGEEDKLVRNDQRLSIWRILHELFNI